MSLFTMTKLMKLNLNIKELVYLLLLISCVVYLWETSWVYPLKVLTVFFHEISHGLGAVLTGGAIKEINLSPAQGGLCWTAGGWRFVVLPAGYLGSMIFGGAILVAACRTDFDRQIMQGLGIVLLIISIIYVRPFLSFGFGFGVAASFVMLGLATYSSKSLNDLSLKLIGLTSCLYAVLDIKSDLIDRDIPESDASRFAELFGGTSYMWGIIWMLIAIVASVYFFIIATRKNN